ncbi:hypothetical protein Q3G72_027570 [Acer saccharum]|nr:hypothetical protein Q3G72_027570 [Acer saccharum]
MAYSSPPPDTDEISHAHYIIMSSTANNGGRLSAQPKRNELVAATPAILTIAAMRNQRLILTTAAAVLSHIGCFKVLMMEAQDHSEHSQDFNEHPQDDNEHTQGERMLPPPLGVFETREILLKHVRDFALKQGYMVSIKDSSSDRYVTIACDRGGVYRRRLKTGENMRQRKTPSRLTNCPFEVVGKKDDDSASLQQPPAAFHRNSRSHHC